MAAVAGSKGRIQTRQHSFAKPNPQSFQATIAGEVLHGHLSPKKAAMKIATVARLREVGIDTNMACNLRCAYCYLDDRPVEKAQLTPDAWFDRLSPLVEKGCKLFAFIGKEPLLDEVAVTLLERLEGNRHDGSKFRTGLVTNGTLLHRYLERIRSTGLSYLDISLDGLPNVNDVWRGEGAGESALQNLRLLLSCKPKHDVFVSSVLHQGNVKHIPAFLNDLFGFGLTGFFTSPVLRFTENGQFDKWSISPRDLLRVIDDLIQVSSQVSYSGEHQVILDLPYRYAWWLLASGYVQSDQVFEDCYEVPYVQPDASIPFFLKMNLISYSYYRAIRITHDGTVIANLDLAAHPEYRINSAGVEGFFDHRTETAVSFHTRFIDEHRALGKNPQRLFDRNVGDQFAWQASHA